MIKKYKKKPIVIEAIKLTKENALECIDFASKSGAHLITQTSDQGITIPTLEGNHLAKYGDYVIKGVQGEFYPCKPDIFEATYDEVGDE